MWELLYAPFMIRAIIAAAVTGLAAPGVGTYLVQRRLSLMGDGIGHITVTGVALGLLTGTSPTFTAVVVAVIGALLIELIRASGRASGDLALALLFYGGIAGGLVLVQMAGNGAFALQGYLFGSIATIAPDDVVVSVILAGIAIVVGLALMPQLFAVSNDEEFARASGVPAWFYNALISVLAAVTVSVAMRTVGLLLVSALMIIPVATSQQFTRSFRTTMLAAMGFGLVAALVGVVVSAYLNLPPGATIVLVALAGFVVTSPVGLLLQRRRRARVPFDPEALPLHEEALEAHRHVHGPGCGHVAVEHGDHVDYVHDGHRHAVHVTGDGKHYDEH
ncbi:metal ABC transporter permease [Nocardioides sp.]|jgi:zinc transport system permease protein|uniref:metal ABC transporter permease n=1 Tax=Nocardioides sp. TaxID=35761 RepID=UPI002F41F5B9